MCDSGVSDCYQINNFFFLHAFFQQRGVFFNLTSPLITTNDTLKDTTALGNIIKQLELLSSRLDRLEDSSIYLPSHTRFGSSMADDARDETHELYDQLLELHNAKHLKARDWHEVQTLKEILDGDKVTVIRRDLRNSILPQLDPGARQRRGPLLHLRLAWVYNHVKLPLS